MGADDFQLPPVQNGDVVPQKMSQVNVAAAVESNLLTFEPEKHPSEVFCVALSPSFLPLSLEGKLLPNWSASLHMVISPIPSALPKPQDIAVGAFLLTPPQILW